MRDEQVFNAGEFHFEGGARVQDMRVAYWTAGKLRPSRDNVLLLCHGASGNLDWAQPFCRPGGAFDPAQWFIVSADMPGGGGSSRRRDDPDFPAAYAIGDLGTAAIRLLDRLDLPSAVICGPSMASLIGLDLARRAPDRVRGLALWVGSYRSDGYARAIAEAVGAILNLGLGRASLRAAAAAFVPLLAGREMIARMGRAELDATLDAVCRDWERNWHPQELASRYAAVAACDLGRLHGGEAALASAVRCPTLFLQASSDGIFGSEDVLRLAALMPRAEVQVLETALGHIAPSAPPSTPEFAFFDGRTAAFLEQLLK